MNKPKTLLIEFCWLFLSAIITVLIFILLFGKSAFQKTIDINLHDTYFVTSSIPLYFTSFIIIGFIIFYIKEHKKNFKRKTQNIITVIFGILFIVALTRIATTVSLFKGMEMAYNSKHQSEPTSNGWTIYPPLKNLKKPESKSTISLYDILAYSIMLVQVLIVSLLLKLGYNWGKSKIDIKLATMLN